MLTSRLATTILGVFGRQVEPPPEIPPEMIPDGVILRRGSLIPRLGGMFSKMRRPAAAVTLGNTIVVDPTARITVELLVHELVHVRQWREEALFPVRYLLLTAKYGYRENPYEVEARAVARSPRDYDSSEAS